MAVYIYFFLFESMPCFIKFLKCIHIQGKNHALATAIESQAPTKLQKMFISWPSFGIKRSQSSPLDLNSTRKKTELSNVLLRQSCVEAVFIEGLLIAPSPNSTTALSSRTPRTCLLEKNPRVLVKQ